MITAVILFYCCLTAVYSVVCILMYVLDIDVMSCAGLRVEQPERRLEIKCMILVML